MLQGNYGDALKTMRDVQLQEAAKARMAWILREFSTDVQRLRAGDRAYQQGDIRLASCIYVRVAGSCRPNPITFQARDRLKKLTQEAQDELREIDSTLAPPAFPLDVSPYTAPPGPISAGQVLNALQAYDNIAAKYAGVPAAKREIAAHLARQRKKPEYAAVIKEPQAKRLLELAWEHEQRQELCCAYWVYRDAARLAPAPSALQARERLDALASDPETIRAAEICRELQWCHRAFQRAEMLAKVTPEAAQRVYGEILNRAPEDSEVYRAALAGYETLAAR